MSEFRRRKKDDDGAKTLKGSLKDSFVSDFDEQGAYTGNNEAQGYLPEQDADDL